MGEQSVQTGIPTSLKVIINSTIQALYMFVMILIGLRLQNRTELSAPILDGIVYHKKGILYRKNR
ncbi:hypothetical protein SporoP8_01915 [Sporosarcina ureae]|nr:hypothetical protein SporoP8_01915 [Sporosarcina ureae]